MKQSMVIGALSLLGGAALAQPATISAVPTLCANARVGPN